MKRYKLNMLMAAMCVVGVSGCSPKTVVPEPAKGSPVSVIDYEYKTESRAEISFMGSDEAPIEITDYVTNYDSGEIFLTAKGLSAVFGLEQVEPTEADKTTYKQYESDNNFESGETTLIKLANNDHTFLFKEGTSLYIYNGTVNNTADAIMKTEAGELSYPVFDVIFKLGYESIGTSINENIISYVIYESVATSSSPDLPEEETTEAQTEPAAEVEESIEAAEISELDTNLEAESGVDINGEDTGATTEAAIDAVEIEAAETEIEQEEPVGR